MHNDFLIYNMYFLIISNVIAFKTLQVLSTHNKIFALTDLIFQGKHDCVRNVCYYLTLKLFMRDYFQLTSLVA